MIALLISLVVAVSLIITLTYLLGFRLGGEHWLSDMQRVRSEAANAERQLHDLTRSAFVAMTEEAERRRPGGRLP